MADAPVARRVEDAVTDAVAELGLLVEDVTVTPAGKRRVVRIAVDRDLGEPGPIAADAEDARMSAVPPLDLDAVADATRAISAVLDDSDVLGAAPYTLEVTSPGVSRPLTLPRHFRRNVGRLVRLVFTEGEPVTGRVLSAGSDVVRVRVEGPGDARIQTHPLDRITRGDVQVEFGRTDDEFDDIDDIADADDPVQED